MPPSHDPSANQTTPSRRDFLRGIGGGFGGIALAEMLARQGLADGGLVPRAEFNGGIHHPAKVRRIIQLFMTGGVSHVDTYDHKPELDRRHGQLIEAKDPPEGFSRVKAAAMKSPFAFQRHGQTGQWVSEVFPYQAAMVDRLTFLMGMTTKTNVHGPGTYMMNTGFLLPGFPSMGAWISYALGNLVDNLPTFVVLPDARGLPYNQKGPFTSGFLPAGHQGTVIQAASPQPVPDLKARETFPFATREADRDGLDVLRQLNQDHAAEHPGDSRLEARIGSYELAAKLQLSAPEAFDLAGESSAARQAYGLDSPVTEDFGRRCLLARRLVERGVRFVQVWSGPGGAENNWDNHGHIRNQMVPMAASIDKPIAALLQDLQLRGLLDDTLVVWTSEFGRTPYSGNGTGRDHNGGTFVTWLAGAGVEPGVSIGASDELGFRAVESPTYCYDLHATILHLMGIDHQRLIVRSGGIDRRLTDVHGHVIRPILRNPVDTSSPS